MGGYGHANVWGQRLQENILHENSGRKVGFGTSKQNEGAGCMELNGRYPTRQVLCNLFSSGKSSTKSMDLPSRIKRDAKFCFPVCKGTGMSKPKLQLDYSHFRFAPMAPTVRGELAGALAITLCLVKGEIPPG